MPPRKKQIRSHSPTSPQAINRQKQTGEMLQMRAAGATHREIGEAFGLHHSTVQERIEKALMEVKTDSVEAMRNLSGQRLERLLRAVWVNAITATDPAVQVNAVREARRLIEDWNKLWGLNHADGIAERAARLDEQYIGMLNSVLTGVFAAQELSLTAEQQAVVRVLVPQQIRALGAVIEGELVEP